MTVNLHENDKNGCCELPRKKFYGTGRSSNLLSALMHNNIDIIIRSWTNLALFLGERRPKVKLLLGHCDQIGLFLIDLGDKGSSTFWSILKKSLLSKNCSGYFWGNIYEKWAIFYSSIWSHCPRVVDQGWSLLYETNLYSFLNPFGRKHLSVYLIVSLNLIVFKVPTFIRLKV